MTVPVTALTRSSTLSSSSSALVGPISSTPTSQTSQSNPSVTAIPSAASKGISPGAIGGIVAGVVVGVVLLTAILTLAYYRHRRGTLTYEQSDIVVGAPMNESSEGKRSHSDLEPDEMPSGQLRGSL
jgi:hypothetical protein